MNNTFPKEKKDEIQKIENTFIQKNLISIKLQKRQG